MSKRDLPAVVSASGVVVQQALPPMQPRGKIAREVREREQRLAGEARIQHQAMEIEAVLAAEATTIVGQLGNHTHAVHTRTIDLVIARTEAPHSKTAQRFVDDFTDDLLGLAKEAQLNLYHLGVRGIAREVAREAYQSVPEKKRFWGS